MDINTLIGLGILGGVGWLLKAQLSMRVDIQAIKTTIGINGSGPGLVQEVANLRQRTHDHANDLTVLMTEREMRRGTA